MGAPAELRGAEDDPLPLILQGSAWAAPPPRACPAPGVPGLRVPALGLMASLCTPLFLIVSVTRCCH